MLTGFLRRGGPSSLFKIFNLIKFKLKIYKNKIINN